MIAYLCFYVSLINSEIAPTPLMASFFFCRYLQSWSSFFFAEGDKNTNVILPFSLASFNLCCKYCKLGMSSFTCLFPSSTQECLEKQIIHGKLIAVVWLDWKCLQRQMSRLKNLITSVALACRCRIGTIGPGKLWPSTWPETGAADLIRLVYIL